MLQVILMQKFISKHTDNKFPAYSITATPLYWINSRKERIYFGLLFFFFSCTILISRIHVALSVNSLVVSLGGSRVTVYNRSWFLEFLSDTIKGAAATNGLHVDLQRTTNSTEITCTPMIPSYFANTFQCSENTGSKWEKSKTIRKCSEAIYGQDDKLCECWVLSVVCLIKWQVWMYFAAVFDEMTVVYSYVALTSDWLTSWSRTSVTQYSGINNLIYLKQS